jgi:Flp pilus assembly protein TadG
MKSRFQDSRGAALVELAIVTPIFFLVMMGAMEIGRVGYYAIEIENAARAGAAYGAVNIGNANLTSNVQQAAKNDAPDVSNLIVVTQGSQCVCETIDPTTSTPTFNPASGTTSCDPTQSTITADCTADSSTSIQSVVEYVTVSTSASISPLVQVPGLPSTYSLSGYSAMRILHN